MLLAGWNPDDVSGVDFFDRVTPPLNAAGAGRDDQDLTAGMRVPGCPGAGCKRDRPATGVRGLARLEQHLHSNVTREVRRRSWPDGARSAAGDDQCLGLRGYRGDQKQQRQHRGEVNHVYLPSIFCRCSG